ncbi:carboxymuconolactone decarboxylase family protein [Marinitenerispora sediminis]|uniref:Carboxymuconolactone decarboxylase n=1 Tax=Marinitenerispora sediminis TaxID=1931232 RepID=A0A368T2R8_9ACTN|nr:carboxymuconolactone decarboxylase family protein [Marinitenerispora sediminis]RCV52183.1 carboxymuconolactone decarboxylase [Marinitenerispora sediminis]RCV53100.1 carboxymuconolactone decarboxylase [Marinitenerispora sediminis]RCV56225.1 carboxymuconolactone decarboxylase [Marinitenerispora sediminis]
MSTITNETVEVPQRLDIARHSAAAYRAMAKLEQTVHGLGLEPSLLELVKIRASQINGCAFCLDMHTKDAEAQGETHQRMHALNAWRETPFFTARERAALAFAEAVTLIADGGVEDDVYEEAARHFDESELAALTWAVATINTWNRLAITARVTVGDYQPRSRG